MPDAEAVFAIAAHCIGGHRYNVDISFGIPLSNNTSRFQAIKIGHLNIHQNQVIGLLFQ